MRGNDGSSVELVIGKTPLPLDDQGDFRIELPLSLRYLVTSSGDFVSIGNGKFNGEILLDH